MIGRELSGAPAPLDRASISLEVPGLIGPSPEGILRVDHPEAIDRVLIRIPRSRVLQVFTRVNTVGSGIVQTLRARQGEVVCELDLARYARRYSFAYGANTLEVKVVADSASEPVYASWVVAPPDEPFAWEEGRVVEAAPVTDPQAPTIAEDAYLGLTVLERLPEKAERELTRGVTAAERIVVQARLAHASDELFVEVAGTGEEGEELATRQEGDASAPRTVVMLSPGLNVLTASVRLGGRVIDRRTYRLERRLPRAPEGFFGKKWAVLIGISDYKNNDESLPDLQFATRDAQALRDFLLSPRGGSFEPERVRLITNESATYREIRTAFFDFLTDSGEDDLVFVFLAGHGLPDPKNEFNFFFLAHDSELGNLGGTALPMLDLNTALNFSIRARRVVVLADACHSGGAVDVPTARGIRPFNIVNRHLQALGQQEGRLILTASRPHEFSFESTAWGGGHGVFTYSILQGLSGEADVDEDAIVTAGELLDYLRHVVPRETKGRQHPAYERQGFNPEFPLAFLGE